MPRVSVDIDLTYMPLEPRADSLANIDAALARIARKIENGISNAKVTAGGIAKLECQHKRAAIKIEINTVIRGGIEPPAVYPLCNKAQEAFDMFTEMQLVPVGQVYGGKICAALDRQHPRDLFDIKYLLANERITPEIKRGFIWVHSQKVALN
jgi:predicted nucleotidyltransferase component of viral defense system